MSNINDNNISIRMVESKLPPGFRFHPRDEELVSDYLFHKVFHNSSHFFIQVDLNKSEPWEIPESACVGGKEWYFYSKRDRKYATGLRTNRATASGYWKATGKDRPVVRNRKGGGGGGAQLVGMRKTLVFYHGRAPKGRKTDWVMHEFRLEGSLAPNLSSLYKEDWVLCRVLDKSREAGSNSATAKLPTNLGQILNRDSTSLPALMDAYISFDHDHDHLHLQQVPCFSNNINTNITNNNPKNSLILPTETNTSSIPLGGVEGVCGENENENENEVLKALLNQLSNPHFDYNLSDSNIWTHY